MRMVVGSIAVLVACGSPPAPTFASFEERPAAAEGCRPPFERLGPGFVGLEDLDTGRSCEAYLEQDECILGIFDDCTYSFEGRREWRGSVRTQRVEIRPVFTRFDPRDRRSPSLCTGTASPGVSTLRLACRLDDHDPGPPHLGVSMTFLP